MVGPARFASRILIPVVALSACATSDAANKAHILTAKQQAELTQILDGKVAGEPVSCIDMSDRPELRVISDDVIVYTVGRRIAYRNDLIGSCPGLRQGDLPIIQVWGSRYCRGDLIRPVDRMSGMGGASCAFGSFTPYKAPPKAQ